MVVSLVLRSIELNGLSELESIQIVYIVSQELHNGIEGKKLYHPMDLVVF